jgi:Immunoglobulin I-set domain
MKTLKQSALKSAVSLALGVLLATVSSVSADVLLSDNFTVVSGDSTDLNEDIPGTRQSGPLAPATYTSTANSSSPASDSEIGNTSINLGQPTIDGNYVLLENDASFYSNLKLQSLSLTNLVIQFDLYEAGPDNPNTDITTWTAISLRAPSANDGWPIVAANEFGFLARANGGIHAWDGHGDSITPSGWDNAGFASSPHWTLIFSDATGTNSAFGGASSQVTFINGTTTLGTITLTQPLATSGLKLHFRNFSNRYAIVENLVISGILQPQGAILTQDTFPVAAETTVGDTVAFSAAFSNSPPVTLQWQQVVMSVTNTPIATNNINSGVINVTNNGIVTSTLTLNNLQTNDSGSYTLQSINANGTAYSTPSPLAVGVPPVNGNVVLSYAGQSFPGSSTNYFPAWPVTANSLVNGFTPGSGPGTFTSIGDFGGNPGNAGAEYCNSDPTVMSDGIATNFIALVTGTPNAYFVAGGAAFSGVGSSITYTLVTNSAPLGFDLTNITVFGGWQDSGRNEQKYQVLVATLSNPTNFVPLTTADYNPTYSGGVPSVTRTVLTPASGALAHNVVAMRLSFDVSPAPKNSWEGYSEFIVQGVGSTGVAPALVQDITPAVTSDVVGSQIVLNAAFTGATSLQWTKNGTNLVGQTASTLTLNNLSTNDAGSYVLVAANSAGNTSTHGGVVTVNPVPPADSSGVITSISTQTAPYPTFTPTWGSSQLVSSLIYNTSPSATGPGDFAGGTFGTVPTGGSGPSVLTDGSLGTVDFSETQMHLLWTCMGTGTDDGDGSRSFGGQSVTYTLPNTANGYTITNITTFGGWNDGGRDQQAYTVFYSTLQNPDIFLPMAVVNYNPTNPVGYSLTRATVTSANGALATNVKALKFDMNFPGGENGYSGYNEFAVYGSPTANPPPAVPVISAQNENGVANGFAVETDNLIAGQLPAAVGPGTFSLETIPTTPMNVTNLTDGVIDYHLGASCGYNPTNDPNGPVSYIVFNSAHGWNLTNIIVYSLWTDYGRDGQFYNVSYSTLSAPSMFLPLATVVYNPDIPRNGSVSGNRVEISPQVGQTVLASNVYAVKFDFSIQGIQDFNWSGYSEIVLEGSNLAAPTVPTFHAHPGSGSGNGGSLNLTGGNGTANYSYTVLTTTNLLTPIANWAISTNGVTDGTGAFSTTVPVSSNSASFFRLRMP